MMFAFEVSKVLAFSCAGLFREFSFERVTPSRKFRFAVTIVDAAFVFDPAVVVDPALVADAALVDIVVDSLIVVDAVFDDAVFIVATEFLCTVVDSMVGVDAVIVETVEVPPIGEFDANGATTAALVKAIGAVVFEEMIDR